MIKIKVDLRDLERAEGLLENVRRRIAHPMPLYQAAGHYMVNTGIPGHFRSNSGSGGPWEPLRWRRGRPLQDTGLLAASISYRVQEDGAYVGTPHPGGALHEFGATNLVPRRARWLVWPLSPPLSISEYHRGDPRSFPGSFFLVHGPDGPGIYRKARTAVAYSRYSKGASKTKAGTKGVERIFAAARVIRRIPPRPFLEPTAQDREWIGRRWLVILVDEANAT